MYPNIIFTIVMGFVKRHTLIRKAFFRRSEVVIFAAVALLIKHSFCNLSKHASPVKNNKKICRTALDFTANPLQQEHVRDSTVKCTPAVRKQLHSKTPPQKPACFVAHDKRTLHKCACMHERLEREKCLLGKYSCMCTEQLHASLL